VLVHVGCNTTTEAIELARFAERTGADGISSLPPYVPRCNSREIVNYYRQLAAATALPCFIYYFPALTGPVPLDALAALPGIRGIKFTDLNLFELGQLAQRSREQFLVFNGHDQILLPGLSMGACGGVGSYYNVFPELFVSVYRSWRAGDVLEAQRRQQQINARIAVVRKYRLVPALRLLLRDGGWDSGVCREPVMPLPPDEQRQLLEDLEPLGDATVAESHLVL
jgi:N-acetylneuraminate lyase